MNGLLLRCLGHYPFELFKFMLTVSQFVNILKFDQSNFFFTQKQSSSFWDVFLWFALMKFSYMSPWHYSSGDWRVSSVLNYILSYTSFFHQHLTFNVLLLSSAGVMILVAICSIQKSKLAMLREYCLAFGIWEVDCGDQRCSFLGICTLPIAL